MFGLTLNTEAVGEIRALLSPVYDDAVPWYKHAIDPIYFFTPWQAHITSTI